MKAKSVKSKKKSIDCANLSKRRNCIICISSDRGVVAKLSGRSGGERADFVDFGE